MKLINWLKSPTATLIVLCSALIAQLPHAADVFRLIVMGDGWLARIHSFTYAVALELAVLLFVVQRRNVESYIFAGVSILVNLSYYYLHGVHLFSVAALPAWLVSIALPAAIAQYSHLIAAATEHCSVTDETTPTTDNAPTVQQVTPVVIVQPETVKQIDTAPAPVAPAATNVDGLNKTQLAVQLGVSRTTINNWVRDGKLDGEIAKRLPALAPVHTNGVTHD